MTRFWRFVFEKYDAPRLRSQHPDLSDLQITRDVPYLTDGDRGHLLDIYRPRKASGKLPLIINIHGGGLFASYKEVNAVFNYEWARRGYAVVSTNYRRLPETTLIHQIEDVMAALRFVNEKLDDWSMDPDRCYLTGDSAGALLAWFVLSLEGSAALRKAFGVPPSGLCFRAAALISIMLHTRRKDPLIAISDVITGPEDHGKAYEPFLLDPLSLAGLAELPPLCLVTSAQDMIRRETLTLHNAIPNVEQLFLDYPRNKKRRLGHVFAVLYPDWPESRKVFEQIDGFFRRHA